MLDTVVNIGRTLRLTEKVQFHQYIRPAHLPNERNKFAYFTLPLDENWSIIKEGFQRLEDEDIIKECYYLTFKTSDRDNMVKYVWGDIKYGKNEKNGYYKLANKSGKGIRGQSSFNRAIKEVDYFSNSKIERFRKSFEKNLEFIESKLAELTKTYDIVFLHFRLPDFEHWYQYNIELDKVNERLLEDFTKNISTGIALRKYLYKTIGSAEEDLQIPKFDPENIYKIHLFKNKEEIFDLLYGIEISKKAKIIIQDIKIIVLPNGNNLSSNSLIDFFFEKGNIEGNENEDSEQKIILSNRNNDDLFDSILNDSSEDMIKFDFIFSKKAENVPDVDLIEISGIEKSLLSRVADKINDIKNKYEEERIIKYPEPPERYEYLSVRKSYYNILSDFSLSKKKAKNKKYQHHLFKILPQIYSDTFYNDSFILPIFIQRIEFNIRNGIKDFNYLKYDYFFLLEIQKHGDYEMDKMLQDSSYKSGLLLGLMAQPLSRKINSFDKNYVGLLSRRISDLDNLIKFSNFINEKLMIHNVAYPDLQENSIELSKIINSLSESDYNKNYCSFGFFESFYKKFNKNQNKNLEDTIDDE